MRTFFAAATIALLLAAAACTKPHEDEADAFARLSLLYMQPPADPENPESETNRPLRFRGKGCSKEPVPADVVETCGVYLSGDRADAQAVSSRCIEPTPAYVPEALDILAGWRATMAQLGAVEGGDVVKVAELNLGDGETVDVLSAHFEVPEPTRGKDVYGRGGLCTGLLLKTKDKVLPVSRAPCEEWAHQEEFGQAFRLKGVPGVLIHVPYEATSMTGAFLVQLADGRVRRAPLAPCGGNG